MTFLNNSIFRKLEPSQLSGKVVVLSIHLRDRQIIVVLKPGSKIANINGADIVLDAMPISYENRIYIPVVSISKCFDKNVKWFRATSTVIIWDTYIGDTWARKEDMPFAFEPGVLKATIYGSDGSVTVFNQASDPSDMAVTVGSKIYVFNSRGKVAEYDPELDIWEKKGEVSELKESKGFFRLVTTNNKIYIVGNNLSEILEYDPDTGRTAFVTKLTSDRIVGGAAAIEGKIYILGGFDFKNFKFLDIVEEFDISTKKWTTRKK